jgi:hypothetical protein
MTLSGQAIETPPRPASPQQRFGTLAVHAGSPHDPVTGAVIEPVSSERLFAQNSPMLTCPDISLHDICAIFSREAGRSVRIHTKLEPQQVSSTIT